MQKIIISTLPYLLFFCLLMQGANGQDCAVSIIKTCIQNLASDASKTGLNKTKLCSLGNFYLNCVNQAIAKLDSGIRSSINQAASQELSKVGCGATPKMQACASDIAKTAASAGLDKTQLCSAGHSTLSCVNQIVNDCNPGPSSSSVINQVINTAKLEMTKVGCENGASGSVYSFMAIVLGMCLHRLL